MKIIAIGLLALTVAISGCSKPKGISASEKRDYVEAMKTSTLEQFYQEIPEGRELVKNAKGYGVFSNVNVNVIFVSAGNGYGVVTDNSTGNKTYMNMGSGGLGLGAGVKDFRAVIIFHSKETMDTFIDTGWEFGAEADAAAKSGDKGGSAEAAGNVNNGMSLYQLTETGFALQATLKGTKYWHDDELNSPALMK